MATEKKQEKSKLVQNPKILSAEGWKRLKNKEIKKKSPKKKENKN